MIPEFRDPPVITSGTGRKSAIEVIVARLKERPGEWALVKRGDVSSGVAVWKRHGCVTTVRRAPDHTFDIYAKWPTEEET